MIDLPLTGLSNDKRNISSISDDRESDSTKDLQVNENNNRKAYPQRNNRSRLNYRDLERGMYEEIRQSTWALSGSGFMMKNNNRYYDGEHEVIDLSMDDDDDEEEEVNKSSSDTDQSHRRLWCICQKPWDHSRLMLRCDSCANWYHGDCIGISGNKKKLLDIDHDQFICSPCQGIPYSTMKQAKSSEESLSTKRKHTNELSSDRTLNDQSTKKLKSNTSKMKCIVHDCSNSRKSGWVYCSSNCIRRHINEVLQDVQRSKSWDNVDIPTSDDIVLYESNTKEILKKTSVPKIENLFSWLNLHPSYQIMKSSSRKPLPSTVQQSKDASRPLSHPTKSKPALTSRPVNQKNLIPLGKSTPTTASNSNSPTDIRSKVPTALYDKIIMRLEKDGGADVLEENIRTRVDQIEQEMFRVYGKVDNSYKNKFRSLLANISNSTNHFFYKRILSPELTAKEIVAMKPEDMLPPEEQEKRKDEFQKQVQMIIKSEEEKAMELARRMRTKPTKQGLVDNEAHCSALIETLKEQTSTAKTVGPTMESKETNSTTIKPMESNRQIENRPAASSTTKTVSNAPVSLPTIEEKKPPASTTDQDNDYIEPESPTGVDALIYDEEDNDDDVNSSSRSSTSHSSTENAEDVLPYQPIVREDYNPVKATTGSIPISAPAASVVQLPNHWRGVIENPNTKYSCQSVHIYGENEHLIHHIPEQLLICGRLRLADLWDYIVNSLPVRDVLILTLISSSLTSNDNELFLQYVDSMRKAGRAAVISKCPSNSLIRDMYILAADTKDCPSNVLSALSLPVTVDSKELFLVIIGSGKKTHKLINRDHISNHLTYKPMNLQDSTMTRDPRLQKNRDPRLNRNHQTNENLVLPTRQSSLTKQTSESSSNDDLLRLISDSLQQIRQAPTADAIRSIVQSTKAVLDAQQRDDLSIRFNDNLLSALTEWQTLHGNTMLVTGDNFTEENMDVEDNQDEKQKKQPMISNTSHSNRKFKDVDYRFLDQEMDPPKPRRKSRFSDILPQDIDRLKKSKHSNEKFVYKNKDEKSIRGTPVLSSNSTKIASPELIDKQINASTTDRKDNDKTSSKISVNIPPAQYSSAFVTNHWSKQIISSQSVRSPSTLNSSISQESKRRFSSNSNEWRSRSSHHHYYMTHYHDFDQPQE